jgi:hypothetical protein
MRSAYQLSQNGQAGVSAPAWSYSHVSACPSQDHYAGLNMGFSRDNTARTVLGKNTPKSSADDDAEIVFIKEYARRYTAKEGAKLSGMTPKGFQKLQAGDNSISYKRLRQWMRNDMAFAIAHAVETGVILPGQAESAELVTRAVNAFVRSQG